MKPGKLSIEKVENGYIVRVLREHEVSVFQARYNKPIYVFGNLEGAINFMKKFFTENEGV